MTNEKRQGIDRMGLMDVVATAAMARRLGRDGAMGILARAYTVDNDMTGKYAAWCQDGALAAVEAWCCGILFTAAAKTAF